MPLELTPEAQALLSSENIEQSIILEIEGLPLIYSSDLVNTPIEYGAGLLYGSGSIFGGTQPDPNFANLISLEKTTYNIRQQLRVDKGEANSVQKMQINLVDEAGYFTNVFAPGIVIDDILGRAAKVYIGFIQGQHPRDSITIVNGVIDDVSFGAGNVLVSIANPLDLTRASIFDAVNVELTADINTAITTIPISDTSGIIESLDAFTSYIRIGDEVIEVGSVSGNDLISCVRGQLGTTGADHFTDDNVDSIYKLQGTPVDLALKILLSDPERSYYIENQTITSFVQTVAVTQPNAIFLPLETGKDTLGVTPGDFVTTTGATNAANNVTDAVVSSVTEEFNGTTIVLSGVSLVLEATTSATMSIKSRYNVLPSGLLLKPKQVDIEEFEEIDAVYGNSFFDLDINLKETIDDAKTFLDLQLYKPNGAFSVPRKGKVSIGFGRPPLNDTDTKTLSVDNIKNPDKIKISRTTNKYFYNSIIYKFEESVLDDKFLRSVVTVSASSLSRIPTRAKPLVVEARGVRDTPANRTLITRQIRRYLDRFEYGAEFLTVEVLYKTGFPIEVGDSVVLDGTDLYISDSLNGTRNFDARTLEVINKDYNIKTGSVRLELLDTNFGVSARFGTISQASFIKAGSTTTKLNLKKSFNTQPSQEETFKWEDYIGQTVKVRSQDYVFNEEVTLVEVSATEPDTVIISALSGAPSEDYLIECPDYGTDVDSVIKSFWKGTHVFLTPTVDVVSGPSTTSFEVAPADIGKFQLNLIVEVHNQDYSITSSPDFTQPEPTVTDINTFTNIVTVNRELGFTPAAGQFIELIGFQDGGKPYAIV